MNLEEIKNDEILEENRKPVEEYTQLLFGISDEQKFKEILNEILHMEHLLGMANDSKISKDASSTFYEDVNRIRKNLNLKKMKRAYEK